MMFGDIGHGGALFILGKICHKILQFNLFKFHFNV